LLALPVLVPPIAAGHAPTIAYFAPQLCQLPLQQSHDLKKAAWKLSESLARFSCRLRSPTPSQAPLGPHSPSALKILQLFDVRCCRRSCAVVVAVVVWQCLRRLPPSHLCLHSEKSEVATH